MKRALILLAIAAAAAAQPVVTCSSTKVTRGGAISCSADVPVNWSLTPNSAGTVGANGVYTAPASITAKHQMGGCQVFPNNSVLNTRIDNLPVEARSAAWITKMATMSLPYVKFFQAMPLNAVPNSTPSASYTYAYTTSFNGAPMWFPDLPGRRSQQGEYAPINYPGAHMDRHLMTVNRQTCVAQEIYNACLPGDTTCTVGTAASASQYDLASHSTIPTGTDAAGLPILPTTLKAEELERARAMGTAVQHAIRFTMSNNSIHPSFLWPATTNAYPYCADNNQCPGYGARFRLKNAYSFTSPTGNPYVPVLLSTLKQYGIILGDGSSVNMDLAVDDNARLSPLMRAALDELRTAQINVTQFEAVDESSLQYAAGKYTVRPDSPYVASDDFAEIVATPQGGGSAAKVLLTLVGPTVGVSRTREYIAQGASAQITAWANGTADSLTYTMSPAVAGASVSASGLITAPATVASPVMTSVRVALASDAAVYTDVVVAFLPLDNGVLRIATAYDLGGANSFTDGAGKSWWSRATLGAETFWVSGYGSGTYSGGWPVDQGHPSYTDHRLYQYTQEGNKDILHAFALPNGNYKVTMKMADKNINAYSSTFRFHLESQGVLVHRSLHLQECGNGTLSYRPCDKELPAIVSDGQLQLAVRGTSPDGNHYTKLSAIQVEPYTGSPYVTLSAESTGAVTFGGTRQLYAVGWWLPQSFNWSVVSGPGTVSAGGLYTAPATPQNGSATIRATSAADPSRWAEITLTLTFGTMSVSPAGPVDVSRGENRQFSATINGVPYPNVAWTVQGGHGWISPQGVYYAPLVRATDQNVTVRATSLDDAGQNVEVAVRVPAAIAPIQVDAGSTCYATISGWSRDATTGLYAGPYGANLSGTTSGGSNSYSAAITGASAAELNVYRCDRGVNGANWFQYDFAVPPGRYSVRFLWAEHRATMQGAGTWGSYKMDVIVNGATLLTDYNPVQQAGGVRIAHDRTFTVTVGLDRTLRIRLAGKGPQGGGTVSAFLSGLAISYIGPAPYTLVSGSVRGTVR